MDIWANHRGADLLQGHFLRNCAVPIVGAGFGSPSAEAEIFGQLHAHLKRVGRPMQVVDIQLAAVARMLGHCTVVTSDTDLSAIPDLNVENWIVPPPPAH